jgi:hypothetical protein
VPPTLRLNNGNLEIGRYLPDTAAIRTTAAAIGDTAATILTGISTFFHEGANGRLPQSVFARRPADYGDLGRTGANEVFAMSIELFLDPNNRKAGSSNPRARFRRGTDTVQPWDVDVNASRLNPFDIAELTESTPSAQMAAVVRSLSGTPLLQRRCDRYVASTLYHELVHIRLAIETARGGTSTDVLYRQFMSWYQPPMAGTIAASRGGRVSSSLLTDLQAAALGLLVASAPTAGTAVRAWPGGVPALTDPVSFLLQEMFVSHLEWLAFARTWDAQKIGELYVQGLRDDLRSAVYHGELPLDAPLAQDLARRLISMLVLAAASLQL